MTDRWSHAWRRGGPIDWTLRVLCAVYLAILTDVTIEWGIANLAPSWLASDGISFGSCNRADRSCRVMSVDPGSAAANAGVRVGDEVRYDVTLDANRVHLMDERFGVTLRRGGNETHVVLRATPAKWSDRISPLQAALGLASVLTVLAIALLLFWRGWWRPVPMLLGYGITVVMTYTGGPDKVNPFWVTPSSPTVLLYVIVGLLVGVSGLAQSAFAMRLYEERNGPLPRWQWVTLAIITGLSAVVVVCFLAYGLGLSIDTGNWWLRTIGLLLFTAPPFITLTYILIGWWRSSGAVQNQYIILLTGFAILPVAIFITRAFQLLSVAPDYYNSPVRDLLNPVVQVGFPAILAYAVLGRKLIDLGFVLNRTIVYGTVSAILLVAFGLIEWAADELVKEQTRVESVAIEAGVALIIFLVFHRVRDFVEDRLEAIFFRRWHDNEAKLKRFVADATHITRTETLETGLVAELTRFTGGAAVALYRPGPASALRCAAGDVAMPGAIDLDDPALVRLRADRQPIEIGDTASTLPAALVLPMFHRAQLIGVTLVAAKPREECYRPDEVAAMANAVHQVGLDLDALRIEELEAEANRLRSRLALAETCMVPTA